MISAQHIPLVTSRLRLQQTFEPYLTKTYIPDHYETVGTPPKPYFAL